MKKQLFVRKNGWHCSETGVWALVTNGMQQLAAVKQQVVVDNTESAIEFLPISTETVSVRF